jgi:hypothetical protein
MNKKKSCSTIVSQAEHPPQLCLLAPSPQVMPEYRRCCHCGSENLKTGAGKKSREQSIHCADCRKFLGYQPISQLKRLRRRKKLTESLNLLESQGIQGELTQLFILSAIGGSEA